MSSDSLVHEDKQFNGIDYSEKLLVSEEFDHCEFINCNFQKSDLSNNDFTDCVFKGCNFSLTVLNNTGLKTIRFIDCKLIGIDFSKCSNFLFSVSFQNCHVDYSSFFQKKMKKTNFIDCSLKEVDFAEVDLSMSVFQNCDLLDAVFMHSVLEKTDFRTARNYSFDPELNKIKKAKFSHSQVTGLLAKYQIDIE
jgi:uncharacterized protein YjbI with pentapeptide repeats